jgi:hypothetical protein
MPSRPPALALPFLLLLLSALPARAADAPPAPRPLVVLETAVHTGAREGRPLTVLSPLLLVRLAAGPTATLEAGWAFASTLGPGAPRLEPGNPFVGAGLLLGRAGGAAVRAGAALSLPATLLTRPDALGTAALLRGAAMRGNSGYGLFAPGLLALAPWAEASWEGGPLQLSGELRVPLSLAFSPGAPTRPDAVVQASASAGVRVAQGLVAGARVHGIAVLTAAAGGDPTQLALTPYARLAGAPGFLEARLLVNLDAPLGFAFAPGGVWGASLAAGARL